MQLTISGGPKGGLYSPLAHAIAAAIERDHPHITVKVVDSPGSQENLERIEARKVDLALVQNDSAGSAAVRSLAPIYRDVLHFLVRRDSTIERLKDIRGARIAVGGKGSGTEIVVRHLTRHYGLSYDAFTPVYLGPSDATDELIAGKIDGMLFIVGLMSPAAIRAVASGQARFVGLGEPGVDAGEVAGFRLEYPFIEPYVIPVYAYAGPADQPGEPAEPTATLITRTLLVCHEDLPKGLARSLTVALFNHRAALISTHEVAAQLTDRFDSASLHFPLHEGARAYYERDKPSFVVRYAEVMAFVLSAFIALIAVFAGISRIVARHKKNLIDVHYEALEAILDKLEGQPPPSLDEIDETVETLREIRRTAFSELIAERLVADESFRIFQGLLLDCQFQVRRLRDKLRGEHRTSAIPPPSSTG